MTVSYALLPIRMIAALVLTSIELSSFAPPALSQPPSEAQSGKYFDHVVIVVLENQGSREALGDANIASLVKGGAWFSNYHGLAHPSLPNYLAMVAGSTFGVERDHLVTPLKAPSIVDRLEQKSLTWKSYAEDYPGWCFLRGEAGEVHLTPHAEATANYVKRHVPLLEFASIQNDPARC